MAARKAPTAHQHETRSFHPCHCLPRTRPPPKPLLRGVSHANNVGRHPPARTRHHCSLARSLHTDTAHTQDREVIRRVFQGPAGFAYSLASDPHAPPFAGR